MSALGLTVKLKGRTVLADVSLNVSSGSAILLVGHNGAGKSTLFKALTGLIPLTSGSAAVGGIPVQEGARIRSVTGHVPDTGQAVPRWMQVADMIWLHSRYYPLWDTAHCRTLCGALEVDPTWRYSQCSKGEARRVQLMLALSHRPALLLLDEALDGVDAATRSAAIEMVADHVASGATAIVASHSVPEVGRLVDGVVVMAAGKVVVESTIADLLDTTRAYSFQHFTPDQFRFPLPVLHQQRSGDEIRAVIQGDETRITHVLMQNGAHRIRAARVPLEELASLLSAPRPGVQP